MDTGEGRFKKIPSELAEHYKSKPETKPQRAGEIFAVGDTITVGDSRFRVRKITKKDLVIRLIPRR